MNIIDPRFERQMALFGREGQEKLRAAHVVVVAGGGLGTFVILLLATMGVGKMTIIEPGNLKPSSRNRYIGVWHCDPIPGTAKIGPSERMVRLIDPSIDLTAIHDRLESKAGFEAVKTADFVFGCLDHDGARFILNELCVAYAKPLIDLASDVPDEQHYGGRAAVVREGQGCLHCMGLLSVEDVRRYLASQNELENEAAVYGVPVAELAFGTGPSVAPINGAVASHGVMEFMAMATGLREPARLINYYGDRSIVTKSKDEPTPDCYYCTSVYGTGDAAEVEKYLHLFEES